MAKKIRPFLIFDQSIEDAIIDGDMEKVKFLLEKGVNVESRFNDFTVLISTTAQFLVAPLKRICYRPFSRVERRSGRRSIWKYCS